jgi:hypothetical protein
LRFVGRNRWPPWGIIPYFLENTCKSAAMPAV